MKSALRCCLAVLLAGALDVAFASFVTIGTATLNGSNEAPSSGSPATGSVTLFLDGDLLKVDLSFSGLIGGVAGSTFIHCCIAPSGNSGIALPFPGFPAATSGTYLNTFDLTLSGVYASAFLTGNGGTAAGAETALLAGIAGGEAYVNIHDAVFPGGEIRGFITPETSSVPEPSTIPVLAAGLGGLLFARLRQRVRTPIVSAP
jgi:hypothetical protein